MKQLVSVFVFLTVLGQISAQDNDWRLYKPDSTRQKLEERRTQVVKHTDKDSLKPAIRQSVLLQPINSSDVEAPAGEIQYIQDERIAIFDDYLKSNPIKHGGYRIQLVFGSRETVSNARSRFVSSYSGAAYEDYLPPNFRLRVGDFPTRFQAEKALRKLKGSFPNAYIVRDKIEVPREYR